MSFRRLCGCLMVLFLAVPLALMGPAPAPSPAPTPTPWCPGALVPWPHPQPAQLPAALPPGLYKEVIIVTDSTGRTRAMTVVAAQRA